VWQLPPLATGTVDVRDRIDDSATIDSRPAALGPFWEQRPDQLPLFVREIAGIILAHRYGSVFLDLRTKQAES
jgi:hypothetical protein